MRYLSVLFVAVFSLALAACGDPGKNDILEKAKGVDNRAQLESALGKPDDIYKLGLIEKWTYNASDGTVVFLITGDSVALSSTGDKAKED